MPLGGILPQALEDLIKGYREGKPMFGATPEPTAAPTMIPTPGDEAIEDEGYPTPAPAPMMTPLEGIQRQKPMLDIPPRTPKPVRPTYDEKPIPTKKPVLNPKPNPKARPSHLLRQKLRGGE